MKPNQLVRTIVFIAATTGISVVTPAFADDELKDALLATKPILEMRLRWENQDQVPFADAANAFALRTRAGFETGKAWQTSLGFEADWMLPLIDQYNSGINGKTNYPGISDPRSFEVKQLKLTNTSLPQTTIVVGRQRMEVENQRFIGSSNWRMNGQTFDAVRIMNHSIDWLSVDAGYIDQANRVYGVNSPQGHYTGDTFYGVADAKTPLGTLSAFAYFIQLDPIRGFTPQNDSNQSYGLRFSGAQTWEGVKATYVGSYAWQKPYQNNPLHYSANYYDMELAVAAAGFNIGATYEVMGSDGMKGFATPIATLHRWDGWADKFTTTPVNGVRDLYGTFGYTMRDVGPFSTVGATAMYHRFDADHISMHYGNEPDVQLQATWREFTFTIKYADYQADRFLTNTRRFWLQLEYIL